MSDKPIGRRGPWSAEERKYINDNYQQKSYQEIAEYLARDPETVRKYIKKGCSNDTANYRTHEYRIKSSPVWSDLKEEFTTEELQMFIFHYGRIIDQFKDDVLPTEEWQIIDAVKLEILMNRYLKQQHSVTKKIDEVNKELHKERNKRGVLDPIRIEQLERQASSFRASLDNINLVYREMLNKKNGILKEMKATRDARVKDIQSGKTTWSGMLAKLIENKDLRAKLGEKLEMMRIASEVEYQRLSELHTYSDGTVDQPILNSDNIITEE